MNSASRPVEPDTERPPAAATDPLSLVRSRGYVVLLLIAAVVGIPISAAAFGFLALVDKLQTLTYTDLPQALGFHGTPSWWPVPLLAVAGLLVGPIVRYLPGNGGHEPARGFVASGPTPAVNLPGVALAALASLSLGAVIGPEAPLIALGSGLAVVALRLTRKSFPKQASAVVGASGSFASISTLLGSPLLGAFLLMESSGLAGAMLGVVLIPGLLASGIGALIFTGLDSWTGLGTYSLTLPNVPHAATPDAAGFGWALVIGAAAALLGVGIRWLALGLLKLVEPRRLTATVLAGVAVGLIALLYAEWSGHPASGVLYSGQSGLGPLLTANAQYSAGALVALVVCKAVAYCVSMAAFRGGPVFPAMFVGAAGGIALSHLPGLDVTAGLAMGVGAMSAAMLKLPMTSLLLATLLLGRDGLTVMPLVIVAVVVSYVLTLRLTPPPTAAPPTEQDTAAPRGS
ncbi:Cl- channel voltage-gated family protein [Streptomyces canus]|uniref:Cl-channel voltage-gated family protein n=1 Tax=Streptomyces canus TaxID=58343 RepID=A0A101SH31_9ACTN|nr:MULTISPECIES: chloride channel protein [Streptomyces]KUN74154.1 Cl- channel voltage-gated family protein [Streptomyces canus]MDI5910460.1 chloride channel protein [Streptomyces sp. 12257]